MNAAVNTVDGVVEVTMPALGESVREGTLEVWLVALGDHVVLGQPLVEISTDKVDTEIPSPATGRLAVLHCQVGEVVAVGGLLATIETDSAAPVSAPDSQSSPPYLTPRVRRLAQRHAVDTRGLVGTGLAGRVRQSDVLGAARATSGGPARQTSSPSGPTLAGPVASPARPAARSAEISAGAIVFATTELDVTRVLAATQQSDPPSLVAHFAHALVTTIRRRGAARGGPLDLVVELPGADTTRCLVITDAHELNQPGLARRIEEAVEQPTGPAERPRVVLTYRDADHTLITSHDPADPSPRLTIASPREVVVALEHPDLGDVLATRCLARATLARADQSASDTGELLDAIADLLSAGRTD